MLKRLPLIIALAWVAMVVRAQDEPEYRLELGAGAGLASYVGDLNGNLLRGMRPMGMLVAKYKPNPRMAWGASLGYTPLKGSQRNVTTWYPSAADPTQPLTIDFQSSVIDFSLRYECHFWAYGNGREYLGARRLAPFITLGTGLTIASPKGGKQAVGLQLPIGLGVKYKVGMRLNLAVEWVMHITGTDGIDGLSDPYGIESSGLFKNTDCYGVLGMTLTYDLWTRCKTCHNDRGD